VSSGDVADNGRLAASLAQLTSGWTPVPGLHAETVTAAREALAATLLAGKSSSDLHAALSSITELVAADPQLSDELQAIAASAARAPRPAALAVVRSPLAASLTNPTGVPAWARGALVTSSLGPFHDTVGLIHRVDLVRVTVSTRFAFGDATAPFAVFPISRRVTTPSPTTLTLGAGSVWFLAKWLSPALPDGFTGFSISSGTLTSTAPLQLDNGVFVAPTGATLTLTATLVANSPSGPVSPGADVVAAQFTPPASVTLVFKPSSAVFQSIADFVATAYGTTVNLHRNDESPAAATQLPQVVIPCTPSPAHFAFSTVLSNIFTPSGSAPISHAGWVLPLAPTSIATLPEAAGPGACMLQLSAGASLLTQIGTAPAPVSSWAMQIATGELFLLALGKAKPIRAQYELWPETPPSKLHASVEFATPASFAFGFFASPGHELLAASGEIKAHVDRPLAATGARFPYQSQALLLLDRSKSADMLGIIATRRDERMPIVPVALQNALIGVDAPSLFTLAGALKGDALRECTIGMYFGARWLLPTLPDPYAASFDLSVVRREAAAIGIGTLRAVTTWLGGATTLQLAFTLLPSPSGEGAVGAAAGTPFSAPAPAAAVAVPRVNAALLDLSTRVDLFGVAFTPNFARDVAGQGGPRPEEPPAGSVPGTPAPLVALSGMTLALNGAAVATFALPQVSWEPMQSIAPDKSGPIVCNPASDGSPLLVAAPNAQQLVPFMPDAVLRNNIANVGDGASFLAAFSLPFGLKAIIIQANRPLPTPEAPGIRSTYVQQGGRFRTNRPRFEPTNPPADPGAPPAQPASTLTGAVTLSLMPPGHENKNTAFSGHTEVAAGYGDDVLGNASLISPAPIFKKHFGLGGTQPGVPVRRIDFSGYGASIFSEWADEHAIPPDIIKVQFETTIGRTSHEVVQVLNAIYPYVVRSVRTVTMQRRNAGWVKRFDSGWKPVSHGVFQFPPDSAPAWNGHIHPGALVGVFNVRNIRERPETVTVPAAPEPFVFQRVLFDADLGIEPSLNVISGGFRAPVEGVASPPMLVAARDMVGYMQASPLGHSPSPPVLAGLFKQIGALHPDIACTVEAGSFNARPGTKLRCTAFEVNMFEHPVGDPLVPALGVALQGAPQIPSGGGWSLGHRKFSEPAPTALPKDHPVPLVRPATSNNFWFIADVGDILQLTKPDNFYCLMHATGTHKVLFESPQIPVAAGTPGLQFPKPNPPGPPKPGAAPVNPGPPNLGDLASILNSTGLFPDIGIALSLTKGAMEQIDTIAKGIHYTKDFTFNPTQQVPVIDIGVINIVLQYADRLPIAGLAQPPVGPPPVNEAAKLVYSVDSAASPSWTLSVGPLSFLVTVPIFGTAPLLTIKGAFFADEHTPPGVTDLNVQLGPALGMLKEIFSSLQAVAQFLPGGAAANLDVALSNGRLTVSDTFTINRMPLGVGNLTDISVNIGLSVNLQPISVDFAIGLGSARNPFNWIVSPLAGNGLIILGVADSKPALTMQAGIGLGLAIDLGIAAGSASVVIAFQVHAEPPQITLMAILSGQASVDVLDGLASATVTLSAALGFAADALPPPVKITPPPPALPPKSITVGPEHITLIAVCSVGIHLTVAWVASVDWDGSWEFKQSVTTPEITLSI